MDSPLFSRKLVGHTTFNSREGSARQQNRGKSPRPGNSQATQIIRIWHLLHSIQSFGVDFSFSSVLYISANWCLPLERNLLELVSQFPDLLTCGPVVLPLDEREVRL